MPPRILILTASIGEGHDMPARTLAAQLGKERPEVEIAVDNCLPAMGRAMTAITEGAARVVFYRFQWLWDLGFWLFTGPGLTREVSQRTLMRLGAGGLLDLIELRNPDVIVSVYPSVTEVLGRLRRSGRLRLPVVAAITDLAAMHYWASRGVDVHLVTHPESIAEVRTIVGPTAAVYCAHGFTAPEFLLRRTQAEARRALGLHATGKVVLVSGGGWGVGDVEGAACEALGIGHVALVVCLCGRNVALYQQLSERFAGNQRVRVERFTDRMPDWLAAADVLVHSTGGLTVLEAAMSACKAISYGWGRGHVRVNNAAFRQFGLADVADTRAQLRRALVRALAAERTSPSCFDGFPSAASFVLAAADGS